MSNFDSNIIKNPEIFEQNRLAAHSDHVCYKNELEKIKGKSSLRYDMNGLWKFAYAKNQSLAPCGFEAADYDCKGWDEIRVPAHIQMEGYDVPIYTNTTYPWEADEFIKPGEVPEIFNPVASYVKYFTIPENMKNKRVCISFQGVESGFALWLNGHYVHYEGVFSDRSYNDTSDMESQMYTPAAGIEKFLAEHPEKPFICCEYTHAMGNSCGAMHKYTELTDREPRYQGGFIWDYIDQSIYKKDRYGKWFLTYGGDFGDRPTDGDFSGNGICYGGEREASPKMQEVKFNYQNISVDFDSDYIFTVTNKNLFVNTSVFDAFAILLADGEEVYRTKLQISVPPMDRASYEVPVTLKNSMIDVEKEYCIVVSFVLKENTIWEKAGYEIAFGQHMIKKPVSEYSCDKSVELVVGNGNILVRGENFKALFSRMNLGMVSYVYGGVEMLPNTIPLPNFWRTPTNNDSGNMMPQRYAQWKIASMYVTTRQNQRFADTSPRVEKNDNNIAITYTYFMPTTPQSSCEVTYRVFGDGTIETTLSYDPVKELGDMPEFGMMFKLDADYDTVKWYGLGPQETYEDRQHGGKYGVYENKVADNIAEYLVPQESGNKCRVRYAKVMDKKGRGMLFFGDELSFSALPYTPHELENAAHHFELPPVHYTVVRVAKKQMGVGGDDSWGAHTHPEYLLDASEKMEFTFCFRGI